MISRCCIGQLSGSHPTVLAANSCPDLTISEILRIILGISLDSKLHDLNNTSSFSSHAINGESATNDGQASAEDHSVSRPGNALCRSEIGTVWLPSCIIEVSMVIASMNMNKISSHHTGN